jgi:UDPglucose 6-dehydrogenase
VANLAERVGADVQDLATGIGLDQRIGSRFLQAGIGWGGSCFGKDVSCLVATGREYGCDLSIIDAAREANCRQRHRVIEKLREQLKVLKGRRIGMLGLAFKPDTDDLRDSPAVDIAQRLLGYGAKVCAHDPIALDRMRREHGSLALDLMDDPHDVFHNADAVVLATEWRDYRELPFARLRELMRSPLIVDGRNALDREQMRDLGYTYLGVGR